MNLDIIVRILLGLLSIVTAGGMVVFAGLLLFGLVYSLSGMTQVNLGIGMGVFLTGIIISFVELVTAIWGSMPYVYAFFWLQLVIVGFIWLCYVVEDWSTYYPKFHLVISGIVATLLAALGLVMMFRSVVY